jgi:hypothetical protein
MMSSSGNAGELEGAYMLRESIVQVKRRLNGHRARVGGFRATDLGRGQGPGA